MNGPSKQFAPESAQLQEVTQTHWVFWVELNHKKERGCRDAEMPRVLDTCPNEHKEKINAGCETQCLGALVILLISSHT